MPVLPYYSFIAYCDECDDWEEEYVLEPAAEMALDEHMKEAHK